MLALSLILNCWFVFISGSNILVLSPITAPSHSNYFKPVVKQLAKRGHTVTYWNGLKPEPAMNNVRQLYSEALGLINSDHKVTFEDRNNPLQLLFKFYDRIVVYCNVIYQDVNFHQLMTTDEHFDLILIEGALNDCVLPLVHAIKAPFIYMNGNAPTPWLLDAIGSPQGYDHFPNPVFSYTDKMNLWQRTLNTIAGFIIVSYKRWVMMPTVDRLASKMLGNYHNNLTSVATVEDKYLSLAITNMHFSFTHELPKSPALIAAGPFHCVPSKPLPKELEDFVSKSGDAGVIIISFGSILKGSKMSEEIRRIFMSTFARLSQRVLWKWEEKTDTSILPPNVKLMPWLPQQDLLGHPKVRLFINHGGLCSMQEAIYHGVPIIALPVFGDHPINSQKIQDDGYGIRLDWDLLTEAILYDSIQTILNNQSYTQQVKQVSRLMHDQPQHPLDRAIYWIEYVIRHKGAPHLRSATRPLNTFQRGLVDVMLILIGASLLLLFGGFFLARTIIRLMTKLLENDVILQVKKIQ